MGHVKLRRRTDSSLPRGSALQSESDGRWEDLPPDALSWLQALPPEMAGDGEGALPFQPKSFRDCMLYERHWVQSSRGYARRFLPVVFRLSQAYEALLRRPFPPFRPAALWRRQPVYYFGNHLTIVPSGAPVRVPDYTQALDYELELAWVLAKPLFNATPSEALEAIGGFVVLNDFSARDVQRAEMQTGLGPQKSKHFLSSISQTLATADEILPRVDQLAAWVEINGQCVARTSTQGMRWSPGEVLAHLSRSEHLYAGELIATGTLPDGSGMETGNWLRQGDRLRLVIEPIGEIVHVIG
jgi:2-keto-4-pentenoate hydratase/2-oxohepta-3-ene-1,7-dioic acid hydratase in catechol pathway